MKCLDREKLFACAHHLLELQEEAEVRAHVGECPTCRGTFEEYEKLSALLSEWKHVEPSPWFDVRVRQALRQQTETTFTPTAWFSRGWMRWLVMATTLVLVIAPSLITVRVRQSREVYRPVAQRAEPKTAAPAAATMTAPSPKVETEEDELSLYQNLPVLENYDLLANFEVLSEIPRGASKVGN